jgi:hypothetical protein
LEIFIITKFLKLDATITQEGSVYNWTTSVGQCILGCKYIYFDVIGDLVGVPIFKVEEDTVETIIIADSDWDPTTLLCYTIKNVNYETLTVKVYNQSPLTNIPIITSVQINQMKER